jgi:hypothetical protein
MATVAQPVNKEDGEYNDICALRDKLLIVRKNLTPDKAEELALFALNHLQINYENPNNFKELPPTQRASRPIYVVIRHQSKAHIKKVISFFVVHNARLVNIDWFIAEVTEYTYCKKHKGVIIKGTEGCLAWQVIYNISRLLYDEGYVFSREWI